MTNERLDELNAIRNRMKDLNGLLLAMEESHCPVLADADYATGNHDIIFEIDKDGDLFSMIYDYVKREYEALAKEFKEA